MHDAPHKRTEIIQLDWLHHISMIHPNPRIGPVQRLRNVPATARRVFELHLFADSILIL